MGEEPRSAAAAYAEHLLAGGVLPWGSFLDTHDLTRALPSAWRGDPPGAAQAELLRRLNRRVQRRGGLGPPGPDLGAHVLRRAAPGRGRVDLRLTDPPEPVPVAELLRVGAGVLADLVAEQPLPGPEEPPGGSRRPVVPARRGPTYRLEGPPLTVAGLRGRLTAAGLPPGPRSRWSPRWLLRRGRPDVVIVVALPLHRGLFEVWARRTQRGATKSWPGVLAEWHATRRLPPGALPDRLAAGWAGRIGADRVHVVTGEDLDRQVESVLGVRPAAATGVVVPAPLRPAYVEVVRRTSEVLLFRVPPEERQQRVDLLVRLLAEPRSEERRRSREAVVVPSRQRAWVRRTGRRTASRLRAGGFVLHGPVAPLARAGGPDRAAPAQEVAVLDAVLTSLLLLADRDGGR